jgi:subtilase family serine protease
MRPGQVFTLFFTVGNRGNQNSPNNACGVYMSTNDFISTSDTRIAGCSWGPGAYALVEMDSISVQVPWSTPTGTTRWFGLHLDDGNAVSESLESNNKVAAPGSPNSTDGVRIQASCP